MKRNEHHNPDDLGPVRVITSSGALYVTGDGFVTRLPREYAHRPDLADASVSLRRDGQTVPLISAAPPVVGERWEMLVLLRSDGIATLRRTTPIVSVELLGERPDGVAKQELPTAATGGQRPGPGLGDV